MAELDMPLCVTYEGHHPGDTTCNRCGDYWHAQAERHAPHVQCGQVHAHEGHAWWWGGDALMKWCMGVERCPEVEQLRAEVARLQADVHALVGEVATLTGERDDALLTIQSMNHGDPQ